MQRRGAKSIVYDFVLSRGVVFSRAATTLRSIETKPFDWKICPLWTDNIFRSCRRGSVSFTSRTSGWPFSGAQSRRAGRFIFLFLDPGVCAQEALLSEDLENFRRFFCLWPGVCAHEIDYRSITGLGDVYFDVYFVGWCLCPEYSKNRHL